MKTYVAVAWILMAVALPGASEKMNVIVYFADDISAREFPIYGSSVWSKPAGGDSSDPACRAFTPVMDRLAREGCWFETAWAATVCSPSRAMMMTGRYAHLHKWWDNKDKGDYRDKSGKRTTWPLYESSPLQLGHLARQAGYGTFWAGKTQMAGDLRRFGFDEGCFTPGKLSDRDNPYTDFKLAYRRIDGERVMVNCDTGKPVDTYLQHGWYWYPHVRLMNHPSAPGRICWWPNTDASCKQFGINTYGPDVELDFALEYMERQHRRNRPFFIYHTTHLGHDAFNWFDPDAEPRCRWPGTPMVTWDGKKYRRKTPAVTGDRGRYDTSSITQPGIHHHINYIDYQIWRYLQKLKALGIENNTLIIIAADNGTSGYGKHSPDRQKGCHVPFIVYAPGARFTKQGKLENPMDLSDVLPTLAEVMGGTVPADYETNGKSLWPLLTTDQTTHRDWIYCYRSHMQLVRGLKVMKDGRGKWWDVTKIPDDLISYRQIKDWQAESSVFRNERNALLKAIKPFDLHATERDAPGVRRGAAKNQKENKKAQR